ncbi:hypothetical protein Acy02nite_82270 [Actinoplanes cyaneus]|uniref:Uncharacterized protein n=1 Tax=Actinoplanes cyaneus TaxID=52696 RepID=A0A919ISQ6_9ACTN|nr:hypothetical protein [Actinoplanes cyaneus]MCW2143491.1 hypothetical protein [Actinoplanes cyaneus]GID70346.1 hypothetical protein Acy02nite_82270 [Actinoplanes cyaneus]
MERVIFWSRRAIVGLLASVVAMTGLVVAGASPASAVGGCYKTRQSTVYLNGKSNEYEYTTYYSHSGRVTVGKRHFYRKNVKSGYVAVTFLACKRTRTAPWTALTYSTSTNLKDLKLIITGRKVNPVPVNNKRGFGLLVQRVTKSAVQVQPLVCTKKAGRLTALGAAKFVTGLPIPVSPGKAVGLWVANNALKEQDDKFQCGLVGQVTNVPFTFTAGGEARLRMPSTNHYVFSRRATWTESCPSYRYCGITHDQVLEVRSGKF